MKNLPYLIVCLIFASCSQGAEFPDAPQKTVIAGKVENAADYPKTTLMSWTYGIDLGKSEQIVNGNGEFRFECELYYPTDMRIRAGGVLFSVVAHPGDSIYVTIGSDRNSLQFSGDRSETNQAVFRYGQAILPDVFKHWDMHEQILMQKDAKKYKSFIDSIYQANYAFADRFVSSIKPNAEASKWILAQSCEMYQELLQEYAYSEGVESSPKYYCESLEKFFPTAVEDFLNGYLIMRLASVYSFLGVYPNIKDDIQEKRDSIVLHKIVKSVNNSLLRQIILVNTVNNHYFEKGNIEIYAQNRTFFDKHISLPFFRKYINEKYEKMALRLSQSPELQSVAIFKQLEKSPAAAIVNDVLAANRGTVIYVDCWATWCGPCLAAMRQAEPAVKLLEKDVIFVYLCLESDEDAWKKTVNSMGIGGQNYFLDTRQSMDVKKAFGITGIPFYMLIDKNGVIVDKGSDLRLDNDNVFNRITKLTK